MDEVTRKGSVKQAKLLMIQLSESVAGTGGHGLYMIPEQTTEMASSRKVSSDMPCRGH